MEFALGAAYDQLKQPKEAIAAYQRAADMEPGDPRTLDALAQALLNDNQLDEALKQFKLLPRPILRTRRAAGSHRRDSAPPGKVRGCAGHHPQGAQEGPNFAGSRLQRGAAAGRAGPLDEAAQDLREDAVDLTSHANGAYTAEEKNNRGIFLERLGSVYHEQNKVDQAIATYQKMIDMGGDTAVRGYQGQVDAYRDAKQFDKASRSRARPSRPTPRIATSS
jgi:tetratricopeptide (TPR) repeat protein